MVGLESLPATFTARMARGMEVHPRDLYRWRDSGEVVELSRGVFRRADAPEPSHPDLLAVATRAPRAVVCCASAAVVHGLSDEMEPSVQIAVSVAQNAPRISYPPTTVFRFDAETFEFGLSRVEVAPGEFVRIYDSARTVVDLMRLRHRLGEPLAHTVLNRYLERPGNRPAPVLEYARALGVVGPVRSALDIAGAR
ncbi:type IV toxin-antitoxin system AbiEi family antitoxin domain-containing protein [Nocardioides sp. CCNWLW239]|uniref:type IV toxin-antitoxin system AbiEi family antitoxin domain-containing protein n=1 Tax=Nocardioides sp. CCNWLW239 TaxID=3128902 RepID=UPI003FA5C424